jgi:hypothetical protein
LRTLLSALAVYAMLQLTACCCCGSCPSGNYPSDDWTSDDWSTTDWTSETCYQNVPTDKQTAGATFSVTCPADCSWGSVWGSGPYTGDSNICSAAIHAGKLTTAGGTVTVSVVAGGEGYTGSTANEISSSDWASYAYGFTFE